MPQVPCDALRHLRDGRHSGVCWLRGERSRRARPIVAGLLPLVPYQPRLAVPATRAGTFIPLGNSRRRPGRAPLVHIFAGRRRRGGRSATRCPLPRLPAGLRRARRPRMPAARAAGARAGAACAAASRTGRGRAAVVRNCHCGRCRKARAAAHATNLVAPPGRALHARRDELRYTRSPTPVLHPRVLPRLRLEHAAH